FPELQGLMGKYYARAQHEDESVATACEDHYKPLGPSDRVPSDPVSISVALADKIDTLIGFWVIGEKPTGSKDPYALRRSALGVIRITLDDTIRLSLNDLIDKVLKADVAFRQTSTVEDDTFLLRIEALYNSVVVAHSLTRRATKFSEDEQLK